MSLYREDTARRCMYKCSLTRRCVCWHPDLTLPASRTVSGPHVPVVYAQPLHGLQSQQTEGTKTRYFKTHKPGCTIPHLCPLITFRTSWKTKRLLPAHFSSHHTLVQVLLESVQTLKLMTLAGLVPRFSDFVSSSLTGHSLSTFRVFRY